MELIIAEVKAVGCLRIHFIAHPAKPNTGLPTLQFLSASLQSASAKGKQKYTFQFLFLICFSIYTLIYTYIHICLYCIMIICFLGFQSLGPEFARMADEPHIILELPGSIVVNFISIP